MSDRSDVFSEVHARLNTLTAAHAEAHGMKPEAYTGAMRRALADIAARRKPEPLPPADPVKLATAMQRFHSGAPRTYGLHQV